MTLFELSCIAQYIQSFKKLHYIKRINDMLFKLELRGGGQDSSTSMSNILYIDMERGNSSIFIAPAPLTSAKHYSAPFDKTLEKLTQTQILSCVLHNNDRILRLRLLQRSSYKQQEIYLQFEFSDKHTNVIILSTQEIILDALRYISSSQSSRPIKIGSSLAPMPQNPNTHKSLSSENPESNQNIIKLLTNTYTKNQAQRMQAQKQTIITTLTRTKNKFNALLIALPESDTLFQQSQILHKNATLLLTHIYELKPYQQNVRLYDENNQVHNIALLPASSPQESINQMFKLSKKYAKKAKNIHKEVKNLQSKINFLEREIEFITQCKDLDMLKILKPRQINKAKSKTTTYGMIFFIEGFKISIGRNERENKTLLENAKADDIWLHIRDVPSSHMIIHCGKHKIYPQILEKAGEILVGVSTTQRGNFCVDYTKRKFVKIVQGANVVYAKHQSLHYCK